MILKRITVSGFKSFCDRVDFDFGAGVTCIVGPNGCGKSNVVDAFKWVLGEQSARSLRGRQMTDMIFNGSSTRKSSGVAQVDLVFDNADRALPLDFEEITVTRKLYRSGESEYLVNQQPSRLKDIRDLFLDTGVGVDAYSVIEQGKVDGLLQSSPQDRRIIFDEAAGISRYKVRRKEAERKLERTGQNLLRVADIIEELEKRLRSVKLQAGKARSWKEYETRLVELRSSYSLAEYHRLTREAAARTHDAAACGDEATALRAEVDRLEVESVQAALRMDQLAEEISGVESALVGVRAQQAAQVERVEAARRRLEEQTAAARRADERIVADTARRADAEQGLAAEVEAAESLQRETQELHAQTDRLHEQDATLARQLAEAQAILEDEKTGIIDLVRRTAQIHNEITRLNTHRESLVDQKGRLAVREAQITAELTGMLTRRAELQLRVREVDALIAEQTRTLTEKKEEAGRVQSLRQQLFEELAAAKERRSALRSRRELLEDLQRRMEGVGAGVRGVLEYKRECSEVDRGAEADWVVGLVADLFETSLEHAVLIEAALGDMDQQLVVTEARRLFTFVDACGDLPERVVALCLDRLPPVLNDRDFRGREGVIARATDLVRYEEQYAQIAGHLLGRTYIVESLEAALRLAADDVTGHRFVTRRGEVVEPDGRVRTGPVSSRAGLISRKSELADLDVQSGQLDESITRLDDHLQRTQAEARHLEGVQQELRTAIYESNTARVEAVSALQRLDEAVERLTTEQPLIARETQLLDVQIHEVLARSAQGGRSLEEMERENQAREQRVAEHQQRIDALAAQRARVQEQQTQARVRAGQLAEKRAAAAERAAALRRTLHELEQAILAARHDAEQGQARIDEARRTIAAGEEEGQALAARLVELTDRASDLRRRRDAVRLEIDERTQAIRAGRSKWEHAEARLHEHQMRLAETNVRRDELVARTREEMHLDLVERYASYEHREQDWAAVEAEIAELRGKMERLGNVNLDAITELEELEQRHAFLTGQRDDLVSSQRQLEQLIALLNSESQQRFLESFEQIRENFRGLFRKLFGGGRADIVLEDPDHVLESGIEIVAQPPGKDLQIISLMSGGEKSMTAIALLMSIFKTRPAPFAIMDEVDAALDEANNERFNRIVREFVSESQFIIITHSRWTMNIGDRLYGITMQEPGVSTRVSVQFNAAEVA